uniref:Uncharacterized protein n=1 Tax=Yersinia enterocolitica TaxID=630 RepID=B0RKV5_YEREN|nr:hypothetical protein [Yersinia enterocolitica]
MVRKQRMVFALTNYIFFPVGASVVYLRVCQRDTKTVVQIRGVHYRITLAHWQVWEEPSVPLVKCMM